MSFSNPDVQTEADAIAALAHDAALPKVLDPKEVYAVLRPAGHQLDVLDLERYGQVPRRKRGTYHPLDVESFLKYVGEHQVPEHTTIWVSLEASKVIAIIDDHAPAMGGAAWREHRVELQLKQTPEWRHWISKDGAFSGQEEFAEHLQEGITEIRNPPPAEMLEIAQTIQGKTTADWKTATRLSNGEVSFQYNEQVDASAGRKGQLQIPEMFTLAIAPFYGEQPWEIQARLRYRIREGNLRIGYKLDRPHEVVLAVLKDIVTRLTGAGFEHVYMGTPA